MSNSFLKWILIYFSVISINTFPVGTEDKENGYKCSNRENILHSVKHGMKLEHKRKKHSNFHNETRALNKLNGFVHLKVLDKNLENNICPKIDIDLDNKIVNLQLNDKQKGHHFSQIVEEVEKIVDLPKPIIEQLNSHDKRSINNDFTVKQIYLGRNSRNSQKKDDLQRISNRLLKTLLSVQNNLKHSQCFVASQDIFSTSTSSIFFDKDCYNFMEGVCTENEISVSPIKNCTENNENCEVALENLNCDNGTTKVFYKDKKQNLTKTIKDMLTENRKLSSGIKNIKIEFNKNGSGILREIGNLDEWGEKEKKSKLHRGTKKIVHISHGISNFDDNNEILNDLNCYCLESVDKKVLSTTLLKCPYCNNYITSTPFSKLFDTSSSSLFEKSNEAGDVFKTFRTTTSPSELKDYNNSDDNNYQILLITKKLKSEKLNISHDYDNIQKSTNIYHYVIANTEKPTTVMTYTTTKITSSKETNDPETQIDSITFNIEIKIPAQQLIKNITKPIQINSSKYYENKLGVKKLETTIKGKGMLNDSIALNEKLDLEAEKKIIKPQVYLLTKGMKKRKGCVPLKCRKKYPMRISAD